MTNYENGKSDEFERAINDEFESRLIEVIYAIDYREDIKDIPIGSIRSTKEGHDTTAVKYRTSRLMDEVAPKDVFWSQLFLAGSVNEDHGGSRLKFSEADKRNLSLHGTSLGSYLTSLLFRSLPIEHSAEGEARVKLTLVVNDDYLLNLFGEGNFDTSYLYDEGADMDEDDPTESEILYEMNFTAELLYCPPSNGC